MAKKIFMTESDAEEIISSLRTQLVGMKCYGAFSMKKTFSTDDRTAMLKFTPEAWSKMTALVARFTTEVQWHGLVRRVAEDAFEVFDILNFPHEVTGATVTSDQEKYNEWINGLDDEKFKNLRFHGHSHVNMPVTPSGTDEKYRTDIITQLPKPVDGEDVFYIFMIINKSHAISAEIYDFTYNALYDTDEIVVYTPIGDSFLDAFVAEAKSLTTERQYNTGKKYYGGGNYNGNYGGYAYSSTTNKKNTHATPSAVTDGKEAGEKNKWGYGYNGDKPKSEDKPRNGPCCGYDSWEEYYKAEYGYDDEDTSDPFYVRDYR